MTLIEAFSTARTTATYEAVARHVVAKYVEREGGAHSTNRHVRRRAMMAERLRYYRDGYLDDLKALIRRQFENAVVVEQRQRLAELAMGLNLTRRIVDEISAVYDKPALREFKDQEEATAKLRAAEVELELHDVFAEANRLVNLCNEVLLWNEPSLRILTPDMFDVVPDPRDPLRAAGFFIQWDESGFLQGTAALEAVHWRLYDETHVVRIDGSGRVVSVNEHGRGGMPGVLVHRKRPVDALLDPDPGKDILAAHKAVVFLTVLMLRLSKSQGENQPVLKGNLAAVAAQQPMDGERPVGLPPDVDLEMLQSKTEPDHYLKAIQYVVTSVAMTYGMSYEQLTLTETTDASSGRAYKIRREKLTEIRRQQAKRWARAERDVFRMLGFQQSGFRVNHAELAVPQDAKEEFELWRERVKQGLDSHVGFMIREDPDLTAEEAARRLRGNLRMYAEFIGLLRRLNVGTAADVDNAGRTPEENGRLGGRPPGDGGKPEGLIQ